MEVWKPIPGFEFYEASTQGRIRSIDRETTRKGRPMRLKGVVLKPGVGSKGHLYVNLQERGAIKTQYVHRLIAMTFLGEQPDWADLVAHRNGDPSDNRVDNVRWATYAENSKDSITHGTSRRPAGERHFRAKLNKDVIADMRQMKDSGMSYRAIGREFGVAHDTVSRALKGITYSR